MEENRQDAGLSPPRGARVLVVEDEEPLRRALSRVLTAAGFRVAAVEDGRRAIEVLDSEPFDVVLSDLKMPRVSGTELLAHVREAGLPCEVILMTAYGDVETAVAAVRGGAFNFLAKPFDHTEPVTIAVRNAARVKGLRDQARELTQRLASGRRAPALLRSRAMSPVLRLIEGVAPTDATVLVLGETGTGKELVAHAVHESSRRADRPFEPLNCSAIPPDLLESELFGHVRGAFTSAHRDRVGVFESAHGGTVFLDEVGELSLGAQAKLLRVLQSGEIRPVGSDTVRRVDVRVVAATNVDLKSSVAAGQFRSDLFYRLNVISIRLPPLRERGEDVLLLAQLFVTRFADALGRGRLRLGEAAAELILAYSWPGNVRELEHAMERAVMLTRSEEISVQSLPDDVRATVPRAPVSSRPLAPAVGGLPCDDLLGLPWSEARRVMGDRFRVWYARALLAACDGNKSAAARRAGVDRTNLRKMLRGTDKDS